MPAPIEFSERGGAPQVYFAPDPAVQPVHDQTWNASRVELGANARRSNATVEFDRPTFISDVAAGVIVLEPTVFQDSRYVVSYLTPQPNAVERVLFEGVPASIQRTEGGGAGAGVTRGIVQLRDVTDLFAADVSSQIIGAHIMKAKPPTTPGDDISEASLVLDEGMPVVFNPIGKPNRSILTARAQGDLFRGTEIIPPATEGKAGPDVHYFTSPGGFDFSIDAAGVPPKLRRKKARFWTYAQALAYVLHFWMNQIDDQPVRRNGVDVFGGPGEEIDEATAAGNDDWATTIWGAIKTVYQVEPPWFDYDTDPAPETAPSVFDPRPDALLLGFPDSLSVQGMNCIEAIGAIVTAAGLGWWVDHRAVFDTVGGLPAGRPKTLRIYSPGGDLVPQGLGGLFEPRLQPYRTDVSGRADLSVTAQFNNLESIDIRTDFLGIVNHPMIHRAPARYEITALLWPGWRPIHGRGDPADPEGSGLAFIDNINPATTFTDVGNTKEVNEQEAAWSEALYAFLVWNANPDAFFGGNLNSEVLRRIRFLAQSIHSNGPKHALWRDVLRKWVIPTDASYPNADYAREAIEGIPGQWLDYSPVNFARTDVYTNPADGGESPGFMTNPLDGDAVEPWRDAASPIVRQGAETWAHRARRFLPVLVGDSSGKSPGVIVEISLDRGLTWIQWPSITVAENELAVWLEFANPFDVRPPDVPVIFTDTRSNMIHAYLFHDLRVRITATIEGSGNATAEPKSFVVNEAKRAAVALRGDGYRRETIQSIHKGDTTPDPTQLPDLSTTIVDVGPPGTKRWLARELEPRRAMIEESNRVQAIRGDPKTSGNFTIPWIETDAAPGQVVPEVVSLGGAAGTVPRNLDFKTQTVSGFTLAPSIVGIVMEFGADRYATTVAIEDWRTLGASDA